VNETQIRRDCAERVKALKLYSIDVGNMFVDRDYRNALVALQKAEQYINSIRLDLEALIPEKEITDLKDNKNE